MLTLEKRIDTYLAQNGFASEAVEAGHGRLTAPQERRLRKVANRQARQQRTAKSWRALVQETPEIGTSGDFGPVTVPDGTPCPRCKAAGDDPCVTPSGKATKTHKGRTAVAA